MSLRCVLKVNLQKAFDTVNWGFLLVVLRDFDFPQQFVQWMLEYVTSVSYSVSINGAMHEFFKGRRGLRQGNPQSPVLFGLYLEVFSRSMKMTSQRLGFHFHPLCVDIDITHLAYADDLLISAQADESSTSLFADCIQTFGDLSRTMIEFQQVKSMHHQD